MLLIRLLAVSDGGGGGGGCDVVFVDDAGVCTRGESTPAHLSLLLLLPLHPYRIFPLLFLFLLVSLLFLFFFCSRLGSDELACHVR